MGDGYKGDNDGHAEVLPRNIDGKANYGVEFPNVSVWDTVRLQLLLLKNELKINLIKCVIRSSFGGMKALENCVMAGTGGGGNGRGDGGSRNKLRGDLSLVSEGALYGVEGFMTKRNGHMTSGTQLNYHDVGRV